MKFEKFYLDGSMACEDRAETFNDEFDQTVFCGANLVYGTVKSPRYFGSDESLKIMEEELAQMKRMAVPAAAK